MNNRFSRMGKTLLGAMCLLSTCGLTYSCSDDYNLDEDLPDFLGGSIYDELKARNFNTVVKLIDDLDYTDVLSRTGSKTLFVADDAAYEKFFATTTWTDGNGNPIRSYDQLSAAQKRLLLYGSLLNNADVIEMLPYSNGGGSLTMRRSTAATAVDSVRYWKWNELPDNLNVGEVDEEGNTSGDRRFWDSYRTQARGGIYMALDASSPMMVHFIEDQLKVKDITHDDISFIMNNKNPWANGSAGGRRTYIYNAQVTEQDVTCLNGYFNVLDTVLVTPPNMAEVIRTNGQTNLFSKMLDRFSAPYYNASLTSQYKQLYDIGNDSVYEKRYIASRTASNGTFDSDGAMVYGPDRKSLGDFPFLTYDPGWNEYAISSSTPAEQDMGAFFVPNDAAMVQYFVYGGGKVLMDRYATRDNNEANLEYNLYQIPLDIIQALINNLMKDSFLESVPSKYLTIMNDAQDQMFPATNADYSSEENYKSCIVKTCLANNGVVYIMNRVITPADYASVLAPALYSNNTQIVKTVVRADDNYIEGSSYNNAPLKKYYSTYLKAMQSRFSFFVPTDDGLGTYGLIDPMSFARTPAGKNAKNNRCYWRFAYKSGTSGNFPIESNAYVYNLETGQNIDTDSQPSSNKTSKASAALTSGTGATKKNLLVDMIDQHIVVHDTDDSDNSAGMNSKRTYFLSRGGAPVHVISRGDASNNGVGMQVEGGLQIQLAQDEYPANDYVSTVTEGYDMTSESNGYGNGMTYLIDRAMQPTTNSVYYVLQHDADHYSEFFALCQANFSAEQLELAGFKTDAMEKDNDLWTAEQKKYRIFTEEGVHPANGEQLVRFFNNYRYTIYAPTNAAIENARSNGLMTYEEIIQWMDDHQLTDESGNPYLSTEDQAKAQAMITMLINFVKYHFQDESLFVDNVTASGEYQTSCIDEASNVYLKLSVSQTSGALTVTDATGASQNVIAPYNILARDADFNAATTGTSVTGINNSSFVVIHSINTPLHFATLTNGRYDSAWATAASAKAFVKRYQLR